MLSKLQGQPNRYPIQKGLFVSVVKAFMNWVLFDSLEHKNFLNRRASFFPLFALRKTQGRKANNGN